MEVVHGEGSESQHLRWPAASDNVDARACSLLTTNSSKMHPRIASTVFLKDVQGVEEN